MSDVRESPLFQHFSKQVEEKCYALRLASLRISEIASQIHLLEQQLQQETSKYSSDRAQLQEIVNQVVKALDLGPGWTLMLAEGKLVGPPEKDPMSEQS